MKKMNKKTISAIAAMTVSSMMMLGCGTSSLNTPFADAQSESVAVKTEKTEESKKMEQSEAVTKNNEGATTEESNETAMNEEITETIEMAEKEDETVIDFEPTTILDNEECSIVVNRIERNGALGTSMELTLENKSKDKTYEYTIDGAAVNGLSLDPFLSTEVPAEKKANDRLFLSDARYYQEGSDFYREEIGDLTDIELTFRIYDAADEEKKDIVYETVHVYPFGQQNATMYTREPQESDVVLVDNDEVKVVVTKKEVDSQQGCVLNFYLENKTNYSIAYQIEDISINEYMTNPYWYDKVNAGKIGLDSIQWTMDELEDIGIKDSAQIETLELQLNVYYFDDVPEEELSSDDLVDNTFTLKMK